MSNANAVIRIVKKLSKSILALLIIIMVGLFFVGGGCGKKENLPASLISQKKPFLFAHRGVATLAPENSYAAVQLAKEKGFRGVEIDIQKSADNHFFLFHDENTKRMLNKPGIAHRHKLEELQSRYIYFRGDTTAQRIISFEDFIKHFNNDFIVYFDYKRNHKRNFPKLAREIDQLLSKYDLYESVIVANGNMIFMTYLEYTYPKIMTCLQGFDPVHASYFTLIPANFQPDFIASFHDLVDEEALKELKETNMLHRYITYSVDERNFEHYLELGIINFIADYGEYLNKFLHHP